MSYIQCIGTVVIAVNLASARLPATSEPYPPLRQFSRELRLRVLMTGWRRASRRFDIE